MTGYIKALQLSKGFGFIAASGTPVDLFFHASALVDGLEFDEQLEQRPVEFDTVDQGNGKIKAIRVRPAR